MVAPGYRRVHHSKDVVRGSRPEEVGREGDAAGQLEYVSCPAARSYELSAMTNYIVPGLIAAMTRRANSPELP